MDILSGTKSSNALTANGPKRFLLKLASFIALYKTSVRRVPYHRRKLSRTMNFRLAVVLPDHPAWLYKKLAKLPPVVCGGDAEK
jgi:hypothetical protein